MHDLFDTNVQDFLGAIYNLKTNMLESLFTQQIIPNCEPQKNVLCLKICRITLSRRMRQLRIFVLIYKCKKLLRLCFSDCIAI